jgi:hypothetical protein
MSLKNIVWQKRACGKYLETVLRNNDAAKRDYVSL